MSLLTRHRPICFTGCGILNAGGPPLPGPLLHRMEEREMLSGTLVKLDVVLMSALWKFEEFRPLNAAGDDAAHRPYQGKLRFLRGAQRTASALPSRLVGKWCKKL